tara:strand:- start:257 stop:523 length:267 start_codon:yes stop_codon:yes gene_type:complete
VWQLIVGHAIIKERLKMIKKLFLVCAILSTCTSCSEFALLASGASIAGTQNAYVKAYNGVDVLTIMSTEKDIKKHVYDKIREHNKKER